MATTVKEKSPLFMTMVFKDELGVLLVPTTVEWRLDDKETEPAVEIVPWTAIPAPTSTMTLTIPGSDNFINDETKVKEARMFGIRVDDGLIGEAHDEFPYDVINVTGPTGP